MLAQMELSTQNKWKCLRESDFGQIRESGENMGKSVFKMNQVGYVPSAVKMFLYTGSEDVFTVTRLQDTKFTPVYKGELVEVEGDGSLLKRGDFTQLNEEGIYRITTASHNSRCFIIGNEVYDTVARMNAMFFTWQRCGDPKGWNGCCHMDDHILLDGRKSNLQGGHHQSGDLRKWAWGTSLGLIGYAEYALEKKTKWAEGLFEEELWHGAKYYLSLISEKGYLYDSSWLPNKYDESLRGVGMQDYQAYWQSSRRFYDCPCPESAHWSVIRYLSLCALFFKNSDRKKSALSLAGAKKIWNYMLGKENEIRDYDFVEYPPLGHDEMKRIFQGFYPGSSLQLGAMACAGIALWKAEQSELIYKIVVEALDELAKMQGSEEDGNNPAQACFREGSRSLRLSNNYYYFFHTNIPIAFAEALEAWPLAKEAAVWKHCAVRIAEQHKISMEWNPYKRIPSTWHIIGENAFEKPALFSFSTDIHKVALGQKNGTFKIGSKVFEAKAEYYNFCYNLDLLAAGVFLYKMAKITNNITYKEVAQHQLDWILGCNHQDSSSVEGVGYNQAHRGIFGEFFPPVPQIPGGVNTGWTEESFREEAYGLDCEYDMPMTGWLMYLLKEATRA